jgi:hypothetical protein
LNLPHVSTLEEAAIYLSEATGDSWTPKLVLDFAITKPKHSSRKPAPIAFAAMPIGTTFGRYEFTSPDGMVRNGSARWQLVPLYPIHAAQLVVAGNTFVGVVERPDDDDSDGVHYALIEPLDVDHEVTLDMVRMKRAAIESILNAYSATASSGAPESEEPPAHKATPASWIEDVRAIALEYIAKHKAKDLFPSQSDVCGYIEKKAREKKIYGPQGKPLSQSYIQRNAIQGDWWKQNKP